MKTKNYVDLFKQLNIHVEPLPSNYNPETYGRELMRGAYVQNGVSYSANTDLNKKGSKESYCFK